MEEENPCIFIAKIQNRWRIWIPKAAREYLNLEVGDYVLVEIKKVLRRGILRK